MKHEVAEMIGAMAFKLAQDNDMSPGDLVETMLGLTVSMMFTLRKDGVNVKEGMMPDMIAAMMDFIDQLEEAERAKAAG